MKKLLLILMGISLTVPSWTAVNVPLTIQEAIYPGSVAGVNRTSDPVTVGIPLPDDPNTGITDVNQLTLTGATVGQFRVLGRWPSGRIKWVLVDTQASLSAGQKNTSITLASGGTGNFGGTNLAVDNGSTITVNTGAATLTIKKANFNVIDQAVVGTTTVVASGSSQGLVITGPPPGQTTCPPCTTVYSSANDATSTAVIEENGPAKAVIKATGAHKDGAGNVYMTFTVRMYFYKGKSNVKVTSVLRNANYDVSTTPSPDAAGNTFNTAYKGLQSYELRIAPNVSGTLNYTIATHATPQTGSLAGSDSAYIYQGQSEYMNSQCAYQSSCANSYTPDTGYSVLKNGSPLVSGTSKQFPQGWADISDSAGVGVEIGVYQMAAYWPKSLEFNAGGTDVRIGIFARQNSQPIYQSWPAWSIHDLFLNFHASAPASPANDFLAFQHYLVARPGLQHVNSTGVFPYPIVDPAVEDSYFTGLASSSTPAVPVNYLCFGGTAPCTPDRGIADANAVARGLGLAAHRDYFWSDGGPMNQTEFRWSDLQKFYQRGFTGRFLNSAHFYRFIAEKAWPHADGTSAGDKTVNGFTWRSRPHVIQSNPELNGLGRPSAVSANASKSFVSWMDTIHFHWHGVTDYYFMTGDETIREAILPMKDWYLNNDTYQGGSAGGLGYTRGIGIELMSASRFSEYLQAIGDSEYSAVLDQATNNFNLFIKPDVCVNGYPSGCTAPALNSGSNSDPQGISRVRGLPFHSQMRASWCNASANRIQSYFQPAILVEGLLFLRKTKGPAWPDYKQSLDLAYGMSQWALTEVFGDDGTANWQGTNQLNNGFRYGVRTDIPEVCPTGTTVNSSLVQVGTQVYDQQSLVVPGQTVWPYFYVQYLVTGKTDWERKLRFQLSRIAYSQSAWPADFGTYSLGSVIGILNNPGNTPLNDVPFTVKDNGAGSYTLTWTVPASTQGYRIKWSPKIIAPSNALLGFNSLQTNTFALSPDTYATWFAANDVAEPAPAAAGQTQSITITPGATGLTAPNFSVKAYVQNGTTTPPPSQPANLVLVSGSGQTGAAGQALTTPLTVKVADASANPVAGVAVTFTVTGGGGSLSATQVSTNSLGLASSTLTLGAAAGVNTVTAASGTLTGSPVTFTATATTATVAPANLILVSGNGQTGTAGQPLAAPFTVKVTDASANPVAGVAVTFTVTGGGGSLSAALVATNSQGLASSTLTLGAAAGANTVTATSGTLTGSPVTFTATGTSSSTQADVTWTKQVLNPGGPGYNGWLTIWYDQASQQTILYGVREGSVSIYSTDIFFYKSATNTWTHLGGTGSMQDVCVNDTPTWPGDRHPGWQMAVDSKRSVMWIYGGPNQMCNGRPAPDTNPRQDMYYLRLNADPLTDTWQQKTPAHLPSGVMSAMIYDPDDDVLFSFGYDGASSTRNHWVYCPTTENPTPGVLTAKQSAAGCTVGDDWVTVNVAGGIQPPSVSFPGMVYDTATKKVILYGGMSSGLTISYNQTWAYDVPTRTWTQKALSTTPPPVYNGSWVPQPAMVYIPSTQKIIYHQTSNTGAPADWEYNPGTDTWTKLVSSGSGTATDQYLAYDAAANKLIGFNRSVDGYPEVWQGALSATRVPPNACDLNADGVVNVLDVQLAIRQSTGTVPCGKADLNGDGLCNDTDVQRILNSSLGAACRVGP